MLPEEEEELIGRSEALLDDLVRVVNGHIDTLPGGKASHVALYAAATLFCRCTLEVMLLSGKRPDAETLAREMRDGAAVLLLAIAKAEVFRRKEGL